MPLVELKRFKDKQTIDRIYDALDTISTLAAKPPERGYIEAHGLDEIERLSCKLSHELSQIYELIFEVEQPF